VALGLDLDGARLRGNPSPDQEGVDILLNAPSRERTEALVRLGIQLFFWLAGLVVWVWARRANGRSYGNYGYRSVHARAAGARAWGIGHHRHGWPTPSTKPLNPIAREPRARAARDFACPAHLRTSGAQPDYQRQIAAPAAGSSPAK
jgi:hypothetical protein